MDNIVGNLSGSVDGQPISIGPDGFVRFGADERLNVVFHDRVVVDPQKSRELGRQWSKSEVYVRIQQPGERDYTDRPANDADKARFPRHWAAYQRGHQPVPNGTPIDLLFPQNPEIPANLHSLGVHTVEQLAGLTEHGVQTIGMGATMWRTKANDFLNVAKGGRAFHVLQKQLDEKANQNEVLQNQISMLQQQVDRLSAQVNQKVPAAMVPTARPPIAQQAFAADFSSDFNTDNSAITEDFDGHRQFGRSDGALAPVLDEPLFNEVHDELADSDGDTSGVQASSSIEQHMQPARRGWPKGKPRGPRN